MDEPKLRILLLEDIPNDAELATRELLRDGLVFDWQRVEDETGFRRALAEFSPDLILADYTLPGFDAMKALRILQELGWEIPFILVTGSQSEETAAAVMREGADDYILKSSLVRLPLSVRHTLERWRTKRALRENEELLSNLLEHAPVSIYVTGADGRIRLVNRRWETDTGKQRTECLGQPLDRAFSAESARKFRADNREIMRTGASLAFEEVAEAPIEPHHFFTVKFPLRDGSGQVEAVGGISLDITDRKRAEEALRREQTMLARTEGITQIGSWAWDIATDTVTWSDELFRIFQRDPKEGAPSFAEHPAFYHPDDMARLQQAVEVAITLGTPYELELRAIRKDGETRVCMARGVAEMAPGGRAVRLFGSLQDITERKRLEGEAEQVRTDFLYAVSHELKTPLFLMTIGLELLKGLPPEERERKFLEQEEVWQRNLLRLRFLINNLVDSQRTKTIGLHLSRVSTDLVALVRQAVADLDILVQRQHLRVELDLAPLPPLLLDAEAMERTVHNLLSNAIKFSKPKGKVQVRLRQEKDWILLEVEDHGQGIPAEAISELFQPFARVESVVRAVIPGTGLGLYVSRILVEAHGGTIVLESEEGEGAKVTVRLPLEGVSSS